MDSALYYIGLNVKLYEVRNGRKISVFAPDFERTI